MDSDLPVRLLSVCKEAGRPLPTFSEDPVLDLMVTEAVVLKHGRRQSELAKEAEKKRERDAWKKGAPGSGKAGRKRTG